MRFLPPSQSQGLNNSTINWGVFWSAPVNRVKTIIKKEKAHQAHHRAHPFAPTAAESGIPATTQAALGPHCHRGRSRCAAASEEVVEVLCASRPVSTLVVPHPSSSPRCAAPVTISSMCLVITSVRRAWGRSVVTQLPRQCSLLLLLGHHQHPWPHSRAFPGDALACGGATVADDSKAHHRCWERKWGDRKGRGWGLGLGFGEFTYFFFEKLEFTYT